MTDLISRQTAIDAIMGEYPNAHYPAWYAEIIRALPSAERWIPISERRPEDDEEVIVTRKFLGDKRWGLKPHAYVDVGRYVDGLWVPNMEDDEFEVATHRHTDPIAWMPLPEPYGGEQ